ncbi:hypothetical protein JCM17039_03490 [Blautia glucerasea]
MVSVIIPLYNAQEYMQVCIESVQKQTYSDLQILLVDDGSSDNTLQLARKMALSDHRVHVITQNNAGPGAARNNGLAHCIGEFVCFVDSDDYLAPNAIQVMLDAMDKEIDVVQCRAEKVYSNGRKDSDVWGNDKISLSNFEAMKDYLYKSKPIVRFAVWAKLYRRTVTQGAEFPSIKNSEDVVFNAYVISKCRKILYIPEILYHATVRDLSLSHCPISEQKIMSSMLCNELLRELIESEPLYKPLVGRIYWSSITTMEALIEQLLESDLNNKNQIKQVVIRKCADIKIPYKTLSFKQKLFKSIFQMAPVCTAKVISLIKNVIS